MPYADARTIRGRWGQTGWEGSCNACLNRMLRPDEVLVISIRTQEIRLCQRCAREMRGLITELLRAETAACAATHERTVDQQPGRILPAQEK